MSLPGLGPRPDPDVSRRIKGWVIAAFDVDVDSDATVMVTELACTEIGCPPVETMIAILRPGLQRRFTIHRALGEVTQEDIALLADGSVGE